VANFGRAEGKEGQRPLGPAESKGGGRLVGPAGQEPRKRGEINDFLFIL
jgi:hypothetical protein